MQYLRRIIIFSLSLILTVLLVPASVVNAESSTTTLIFAESEIQETAPGSGYAIDGTSLVISSPGIYKLTGSCPEGTIEVTGGASGVILILEDLDLACSTCAPVVLKKTSNVTIHLNGTNTLTNNEGPAEEETNADFEGAAIKAKSGASVTFCGEGTLNINGNAKNGIKGGAEAVMNFNSGTYNIKALNNGIASDGSLVFKNGTYTVNTDNDGIKSVPDADDTVSAGSITIAGGTYTINSQGDGIQAETSLQISAGTFDITTMGGFNDSSFDKDTMSCKGLKASGDRENIENQLIVSGGVFTLNTADDAIHSDNSAEIKGGVFNIRTGDDGVHADGALTLGTENGQSRDPDIYISNSYEGLEGANINVYSGRYYVTASDDGVNAAGGSDGSGGNDPWNPWNPGGPGHGGSSSDYNVYFYGGDVFVNCTGDGLDSNGGLYMYGGNLTVLSQGQGGDNSPLDSDGTMILDGATVFAAGTNPMNDNPSSGYQKYYTWRTNYQAGTVVSLMDGNTLLYNEKLLRRINYMLYSSSSVSSQPTVSTSSSMDSCFSNDWTHEWDEGVITVQAGPDSPGNIEYTCKNCGKKELRTFNYVDETSCGGHEDEIIEEDPGYAVKFVTDEHASIDIYYTQDYTAADKTGVTEAVSRNSDTGAPDSSGNGQVNFAVRLQDGYAIDSISIEGSYKNLKEQSPEDHIYRITKVGSELTVTITVKEESYPVSVYGHSLSLDGKIGVNFYLTISDDVLDTANINLTKNGVTETVKASEAAVRVAGGEERRVVTAYGYAKEMRDEITLTVTDQEGILIGLCDAHGVNATDGYVYSIASYFDKARTSSSNEKLKTLVEAMDTYGKYTQIYFDYNVNEDVLNADDVSDVTAESLKAYEAQEDGSVNGANYQGTSLELNSASCIRAYYDIENADLSRLSFSVDGRTSDPVFKGESSYYLVTDDIAAKELDQMHDFIVTDGTASHRVRSSALSYAYKALNEQTDEKLQNVCRALYLYNQTAKAYFN